MAIITDERLISVRQAATECGRNMETIRRWIWSGKLPAQKLGNQLFIKWSDWQIFCKKHRLTKQRTMNLIQFLKEAKIIRDQISHRAGTNFDITELLEKSRKGLL